MGDRVRLELPNGGILVVALVRVERIIEDEIVERPVEPEQPPRFSLRFDASQPPPETPYAQLIYDAARRHALNPALVAAVVRAESGFRPTAISSRGARGLMQLMPATAQRFGIEGERVFDPAENIEAGSRYLSWLAERFDERLALVLAAYNAGEGTVERYDGIPPYRETREYLRRIYAELGLSEGALSGAESPEDGSGGR
ncbi:MAG: lytic transglycosylase domain-containing protein [bacterium]|nr:lytic transglycosylase domain-containing protein [bacterium]